MNYTRVDFTFKISKDRLDKIVNNDKVRKYAAEVFYKYMYDYIPFYTGALANTVEITPNGLYFKQPYAHWAYFEFDGWHRVPHEHWEYPKTASFQERYHKDATWHWGEVAMKNHKDDIVREIEDFIEVQS